MSVKNTTENIFEELKEKIMNLEYKPGQIITEQEIGKTYGVSRTPSRDILGKLNSMGLVESEPFKSSYVSLLDMDVIKQSIYMRVVLEKQIIKDAIEMTNDKFIAEMEYNLKLQELLLKREFETKEFYELDCQLHKLWYELTKNMFIWEQLEKAQIHYKRFKMLDILEVKNFKAIYEDHKELVDAIKEKDIVKVEKLITEHLYSGIKRLQSLIQGEFESYFNKK
ncbi:transcriptional regulator, GntR family [Cetobacterium somerae ATCC BAA-474]|uniref:Transcriptional regulator, GntR family n=1 Tax=Cetobacterium somerae ATCC BAA-474 TaxID=1319815 RepID=U7V874_9FUSO|nr:GntR family transcriptional regulator [Cetobacterium somerae]ERT66998.1 transcriptional regulator, GntR family [Cetobacterium somerae ATCC BAA-474]